MSYDQIINLLGALIPVLALIAVLAVGMAALALGEARYWRRRAIKADPALAVETAAPGFVERFYDGVREAMR